MAKQAKKMADFFDARRRSCFLLRSELLKSRGKEMRKKMFISMLLSATNLSTCPEPFLTQFAVMAKDDSALNRATIDVEFASMAVRIFSTDASTEPAVRVNGALIHRFAMVAEGVGEKRTVSLEFLLYLPAPIALHEWEYHHMHGEFFLEAVQEQGTLDLSNEADDEEEERTSPLDTEHGRNQTVIAVPAKSGKSGPKQLAEFHAKQKPN